MRTFSIGLRSRGRAAARVGGSSRLRVLAATASTPFMGALRRAGGDRIRPGAPEENAAFMAVGHAKYTGWRWGRHLHPGARRRASAQRPVRRQLDGRAGGRLIGQQSTALGSGYQQEIDLDDPGQAMSRRVLTTGIGRAGADASRSRVPHCPRDRSPCVVILPHESRRCLRPRSDASMVSWRQRPAGARHAWCRTTTISASQPSADGRRACCAARGPGRARGAGRGRGGGRAARCGHHHEPAGQAVRRRVVAVCRPARWATSERPPART